MANTANGGGKKQFQCVVMIN